MTRNLNDLIESLVNNNAIYTITLSGNIGVGKTTRFDIISNVLSDNSYCQIYPEFISRTKISKELLELKMNNKISTITFQSFIFDEWRNIIQEKPLKNFNLFERLMSETSRCFTNGLTNTEIMLLIEKENEIVTEYNLPSIETGNVKIIFTDKDDIETNINQIFEIIERDINNMINQKQNRFDRVILLKSNIETIMERIRQRNRPGEKLYTIDDIAYLHNKFEILPSYSLM